ncbi:MAG: Gfo/Idh/MocA family oxidoreductase [Clostridia bacterium]|nr:Gfo/Idh/MocA family oxidoreductase [Clostridia bacterium]
MKKVRVGVIGAYRGNMMIKYCKTADNAELVAICDKLEEALEKQKELDTEGKITFYTDYDEFLKHDMDAVVLANYANEHAPFAIKALKAGKHVFSEVLPCQTMKEAVELIETIEQTGLVYSYGENYCYMPAPSEMRKLYREDKIGEFEYGECEYIHNCESRWPSLTYGDKDHWRNLMYATFYCTHSIGPIIHITGLRPVKVTGYESKKCERNLRDGAKGGQFGMEIIELENGGIVKSIHGGLYKNSIWYSVYGSKGRMESAREDEYKHGIGRIYVNADEYSGAYGEEKIEKYDPTNEHTEVSKKYGHGGSDFYSMYNFVEKIKGNENAETIDIFEALDMFLPGMFAYRSVLAGSIPMDVPNLREKEARDKWRNDTTCVDPKVAGDMLIPSFSLGNPDIPDAVYEKMAKMWDEECQKGNDYISNKKAAK